MKLKLIAFDSMGVRSMATVVETSSAKIFIDPGAALAPRRYGLPPHPLEYERLNELLDNIRKELEDAEIVIISHYHYDHYLRNPEDVEFYRGKVLLVKNPVESINASQKIRAHRLFKKNRVEEIAKKIIIADGIEYRVDSTTIKFSPPLPHGIEGTPLGYVLMVLVEEEGYRILHTSDVQGPMHDKSLELILEWNPNKIILCGPPTYFEGYKVPSEWVRKGLENMTKLLSVKGLETLIVDHHLLRDLDYVERIDELIRLSKVVGVRVLSAAEYMGLEVNQLEARRKELWGKEDEG